eukprot:NODE_8283_length_408_cov_15.300836_g7809_i0.p1 GENE.NODE_8283_length_408_cov_15.300836_g7809_i0~~NODE_8283_length_408_cov_15.300836_g7809_i0.p1  ORF type:complete len:102 (+),score=0.33 NODE_8283_length_408_cov_15.300836_g7809_i0:99-404(+)
MRQIPYVPPRPVPCITAAAAPAHDGSWYLTTSSHESRPVGAPAVKRQRQGWTSEDSVGFFINADVANALPLHLLLANIAVQSWLGGADWDVAQLAAPCTLR